jgi:hypothetical protein
MGCDNHILLSTEGVWENQELQAVCGFLSYFVHSVVCGGRGDLILSLRNCSIHKLCFSKFSAKFQVARVFCSVLFAMLNGKQVKWDNQETGTTESAWLHHTAGTVK